MRLKNGAARRGITSALAVVSALAILAVLSGCGRSPSATTDTRADQVTWLIGVSAQAGNLSGATLEFSPVDATCLEFSDRPTRKAREISVDELVAAWDGYFADSEPNAALAWEVDGGRKGTAIELSGPVLEGDTLRFIVSALPGQTLPTGDLVNPELLIDGTAADGAAPGLASSTTTAVGEFRTLAIYDEADRIVRNTKETSYTHSPMTFDEARGVYLCDCSGLVDYVLGRVAADNLAPVIDHARSAHPEEARPRAWDYYEYFAAQQDIKVRERIGGIKVFDAIPDATWRQVYRLDHAMPGDVIAYKWKPSADKPDTGHVMIIADSPKRLGTRDGLPQYRVPLIDSAISAHDNDTRSKDSSGGVGHGEMYFLTDKDGRPVAFQWRSPTGTVTSSTIQGIAIGRAGPTPPMMWKP